MKRRLFFVACLVFFTQKITAQTDVQFGQVLDTVACLSNSEQTYSLYVPSYYSSDRKWPIIFVFEPAARGVVPVRKFRKAAEQLGYIVIASNNSRNGSWEIAFNASDAIFEDGAKRFNIDSSRIYTSGFSGGSRVAVTLAILNKEIDGVIGCGAGLSSGIDYQPSRQSQFSYVGLVGDRDMNYQEHLSLEVRLNALAIPNHRIVFSGIHRWPSPDQLKEAIDWLELQSFKKGKRVSTTFHSDSLYFRLKSKGDSLLSSERVTEALRSYEQIVTNFKNDKDLTEVQQQIASIKQMKQYRKLARREIKLDERERKYQRKVDLAFFEVYKTQLKAVDSTSKTKKWWFDEIDSLHSVTGSKNVDKANVGYRLLNLIWAKFATASFNYVRNEDYHMAIALTEIWVYAEPNSIWALFSMAKLQARVGSIKESIDYLNKAVNAGMKYKQSLDLPEFDILREEEEFVKLRGKLVEKRVSNLSN